jgi:hypothetical protein
MADRHLAPIGPDFGARHDNPLKQISPIAE